MVDWFSVPQVVGTRRLDCTGDCGGICYTMPVTSLKRTRSTNDARFLYEQLYCARGEAENRIGDQFEL
jgi:hypothetical protein